MDMSVYLAVFVDEAREILQRFNENLLRIEKNKAASSGHEENIEAAREIYRFVHTIKGMSATMRFASLEALSHDIENLLVGVCEGREAVGGILERLFQGADALGHLIESAAAGALPEKDPGKPSPKCLEIVLAPGCLLKGVRASMALAALSKIGELSFSSPSLSELEAERFGDRFTVQVEARESFERIRTRLLDVPEVFEVIEVVEARIEKSDMLVSQPLPPTRRSHPTVRVPTERLDGLMNLLGELVIDRTRMEEIAPGLKSADLDEILRHIGGVTADIQAAMMKLRLIPIENVFNRFPRMVRDMSHGLGKEILLSMDGMETELDRRIIDEVGAPLMHLVRNAVDHALEPPEERLKKGKSREGHLRLSASCEGNFVRIEVSDDGRGIHPAAMRERAIAQGFLEREEASRLTDKQAVDLIFLAGFSTRESANNLSGRGLGMDIVRNRLNALGGSIEVRTEANGGTSFHLILPLTLAIIRAMLVEIGGEVIVIPTALLEEVVEWEEVTLSKKDGKEFFHLRESAFRLFRLGEELGFPPLPDTEPVLLVTRFRKKTVGFLVDRMIGQREIVVKPLSRLLSAFPLINGATVLGDGRVALILDGAAFE
ncbi:MAG TPA: hypothetical protein DD435_00120 [Cyanobacteria bacterium UBA8530]|nr:hypothetical protein [Cyanobacteria bacterium UBA8530]